MLPMKKHNKKLNLCILTQDEDNQSCRLLVEALTTGLNVRDGQHMMNGHNVRLIQYENDRATDTSKSWKLDKENGILTRGIEIIPCGNFDGMMVRSWGTASIANEYAREFEKRGVIIANSPDKTEITNSKVDTTKIFQKNNVPMPETEALFFKGMSDDELKEKVNSFF